jgi:uncharacterized membrane protein YccF (DUF307 family)
MAVRSKAIALVDTEGAKPVLITDLTYLITAGSWLQFSHILYKVALLLSLIHFIVTSLDANELLSTGACIHLLHSQ